MVGWGRSGAWRKAYSKIKEASLKEVLKLLWHKSIAMTMRYAHLSQAHKKKAVNLLNGLTTPTKIGMSQN